MTQRVRLLLVLPWLQRSQDSLRTVVLVSGQIVTAIMLLLLCTTDFLLYVESQRGNKEQIEYHREFMRTQDIASSFAKKYNEALDQVQKHFRKDSLYDIPRIQFIEPVSLNVVN